MDQGYAVREEGSVKRDSPPAMRQLVSVEQTAERLARVTNELLERLSASLAPSSPLAMAQDRADSPSASELWHRLSGLEQSIEQSIGRCQEVLARYEL